MNNMSDWKESDVSRLALPQGYERHGITFASLRAADLFDLNEGSAMAYEGRNSISPGP
jgi:hypothetical protein